MSCRTAALYLLPWMVYSQSLYRIENFAGTNFAGDGGPATLAPLVQPQGLAVDRSGNVIFCDAADNRLRRITATGRIETIAGNGWSGFRGDGGPAANATLNAPYGVAVGPRGEIYVADLNNHRVRRIAVDGIITTFAGGGEKTPSSDTPVRATEAKLNLPRNVAVDASGVLYVSDFGANQVLRIGTDGQLLVMAGTGEAGYSGDLGPARKGKLSGPAGIGVHPNGDVYVADSGNRRVRRISAGTINSVSNSNGAIDFLTITSLAIDSTGKLYTAAGNSHVFVVAENGSSTALQTPADEVAVDAIGRVFTVAFKQVRSFVKSTTTILAGTGMGVATGDGASAEQWRFNQPGGIVQDPEGNLYVADTGNGRIRKLSTDGKLSTFAAGLARPQYLVFDQQLYISDAAGVIYSADADGRLRVFSRGSEARPLRNPSAITFDARGDLYVADTGNNLIRKITPDGFVSTVAGGSNGEGDGFGLTLQLKAPIGLTMSKDGTLWFTEANRVRKLSPEGKVTTVPDVALLDARGIRIGSDDSVYVADALAHRVVRIRPDGKWDPIAGSGEPGHDGDGGPALAATMNSPSDVLPQADGSVLIADSLNNRIRRISVITDVVAPPALTLPRVRILHPATGVQQAVSPGQLVWIDSDDTFPVTPLGVRFEKGPARVLSQSEHRLAVLLPAVEFASVEELQVTDGNTTWAVAPVEFSPVTPGIFAQVENEGGSPNGLDNPAARGSVVSIYMTGVGLKAEPPITAEIGGYDAEVLLAERLIDRPGIYKAVVRTPSGFAPSGPRPLRMWVDGVLAAGEITIHCR